MSVRKTTPALLVAAWLVASLTAQEFTLTPLDDFEDVTPWIKGDPNTDLTQKEVAIAPSATVVKQGKQSLAFMVRVDWTPKPGEKYAKGWPMMSRDFAEAQDWSAYDRVQFWLYTETEARLPDDRVLRCGFGHGGESVEDWYTLPGIARNDWQLMSAPLDPRTSWDDVTRISLYIAEQWYQDGDRVSFYVDDMQLAKRNWPVLGSFDVTARTGPRGSGVRASAAIEGPPQGSALRWTISDAAGKSESRGEVALTERRIDFTIDAAESIAGGRYVTLKLIDADGEQRGERRQFLRAPEKGKRTYLSLITFYTSAWRESIDQLAVLNDSAYDAVAIPLWGGYYTDPVPEYDEFRPRLKALRELLEIDPWPWVFSNRFVGSPDDARGHASTNAEHPEYFARIRVLDLDDETGARSDMLKMWRHAVRAAKEWGSPGIVIDLEAYNNYKAYQVGYVAERRGEPVAEVIAKCEAIGADLARICEEEYPECIVWSLFSHLKNPVRLPGYAGVAYPTTGHISLGFLKYAKEHNVPCKYLCGGETSVGYYNPNVEALKRNIVTRDAALADLLSRFPNHFFLAGTISPYHDHTILTSWIRKRAGDDPELKTIEDFQPMFRTLFDAYDWVWVYASSAANTQPYNPDRNRQYSEVLRAALDAAAQ